MCSYVCVLVLWFIYLFIWYDKCACNLEMNGMEHHASAEYIISSSSSDRASDGLLALRVWCGVCETQRGRGGRVPSCWSIAGRARLNIPV